MLDTYEYMFLLDKTFFAKLVSKNTNNMSIKTVILDIILLICHALLDEWYYGGLVNVSTGFMSFKQSKPNYQCLIFYLLMV